MDEIAGLVNQLRLGDLGAFLEYVKDGPPASTTFSLRNEVRPGDLYCYLAARFGPPNGLQNLLRDDSSDNLIHWEWLLQFNDCWICIQGMNFRTEILFLGDLGRPLPLEDELARELKKDFSRFGKDMATVRNALEHWTEFVNPHVRIRRSIDIMLVEIRSLNLDPDNDTIIELAELTEENKHQSAQTMHRWAQGLGLCFGVRAMLPVLAESYVNLILFMLMTKELKDNQRLREATFREAIDLRIMKLHMHCIGFERSVDLNDVACKKYRTLINDRNDTLHGNVSIEKLKFNDLYFCGTVPIFKEYRCLWDRSIGVDVAAVGLASLEEEIKAVDDFIQYVKSCLHEKSRYIVDVILNARHLGFREDTGAIAVLFSGPLADMRLGV